MSHSRKQMIGQKGISEVFTVPLGSMQQKILIEGQSRELPVVIALHGGPGSPVPFSVGCRGMFPVFTERFIMVYWDQLGCGINNYKLDSRHTVGFFVEMTADLIAEVRKMFPNNPLILFGMSWGSVLALKVLKKTRGQVDGVVTWGQVLKKLFLNEEVYQALEKGGCPPRKMQVIRAIAADRFEERDMKLLAGSVRKYTDGYFNKKGEKVPLFPIIRGLLTSKDYRFKDFKAIMVNGTVSAKWLWEELLAIDLSKELAVVEVPYYILQGDTDIVTSTAAIKKEVESSGNPYLYCRVVADSGHMPGKAGMDAVLEALLEAAEKLR